MAPGRHVLIVAHGSRSPAWVAAVRHWFNGVRRRIDKDIELELAFLEITEPLFTDRLRALPPPLLLFPFFLTRSGHAGDEIPELATSILGENGFKIIEPKGWAEVLGRNARRRLEELGTPHHTQVIISGYGASSHDDEWTELLHDVQAHSGPYANGPQWLWAPCGHFLPDAKDPLRRALSATAGLCAVLPLFISVSSYQEELIPSVIAEFSQREILFSPDAILPDQEIEAWAAQLIARAE